MKKKIKPSVKKSERIKVSMVDKLTDGLAIPKEVIYDMPYITLLGNKEVHIENFINIVAYEEKCIRLKTQCGVFFIEGDKLFAKHMDSESIKIKGNIQTIGFLRQG